ncbi:hypothetical protein EVAR_49016_1 [Eumeta japonica]|uniref:Uncharacterized protein n=1 Tax=Eumeta variegata TaxID=151549 RepID=A0A4C1XMQ1_EUMVA|nr:hypothetical protein EVAR_49016_1 [Eumeta japonica]
MSLVKLEVFILRNIFLVNVSDHMPLQENTRGKISTRVKFGQVYLRKDDSGSALGIRKIAFLNKRDKCMLKMKLVNNDTVGCEKSHILYTLRDTFKHITIAVSEFTGKLVANVVPREVDPWVVSPSTNCGIQWGNHHQQWTPCIRKNGQEHVEPCSM